MAKINLAHAVNLNLTPKEQKEFDVQGSPLKLKAGPQDVPDGVAAHWYVRAAMVKEDPAPAKKADADMKDPAPAKK